MEQNRAGEIALSNHRMQHVPLETILGLAEILEFHFVLFPRISN